MRCRLLTLILLAILCFVNPNVAEGTVTTVDSVTLSGILHTDENIIHRYIPVKPGEPLQLDKLELTKERIEALNISSGTVVTYTYTPRGYQILVRVNDSKGFVLEPITFTSDSIINLMFGNLKIMYHNLYGRAINPYLIYNLSGNKLTLGVQAPGMRLPVYYDAGYYRENDTYPVESVDYQLKKEELYLTVAAIPAPGWKPSVEIVTQDRQVTGTQAHPPEHWNTYRINIPYTKKTSDLEYEISFLYSAGTESSGTSFHKRAGEYDITYKRNKTNLTLRGILGRTTASAPVDEWFYLGGKELQRGYDSRSFAGTAVANNAIELGYELVPGSIQLKLFAEAGWISSNEEELFATEPIGSVGIALDWPSPNGLLSMFVATPTDKWQPRISLSFQI